MKITGFVGGFVKGKIEHPALVPIFLGLFFIYNFIVYYVNLRKETESFDFSGDNEITFYSQVTKLYFEKLMDVALRGDKQGSLYALKWDTTGMTAHYIDKKKCHLSVAIPEALVSIVKTAIKTLNMDIFWVDDKNHVHIERMVTFEEKKFYSKNMKFLKSVQFQYFLEYKFPLYFSCVVFLFMAYFVTKSIFPNIGI